MRKLLLIPVALLLHLVPSAFGFLASCPQRQGRRGLEQIGSTKDACAFGSAEQPLSRRSVLQTTFFAGVFAWSSPALAAERQPLDALLYRVLRVREATQQEMRLIKSGKFKDVQRANVKLAVRFMVENYRLNDAFVAASTYLDGTNRRLEASQVGQYAVQNLYTILEYFDSSDVENIKVCVCGTFCVVWRLQLFMIATMTVIATMTTYSWIFLLIAFYYCRLDKRIWQGKKRLF
jgi:hypothetical protein